MAPAGTVPQGAIAAQDLQQRQIATVAAEIRDDCHTFLCSVPACENATSPMRSQREWAAQYGTNTMDIRVAHRGDIPQLLPLIRQYWEHEHIEGFDPVAIEALLAGLIEHELGRVFLAESAGHLVGYLVVVFMLSLEHRGPMAEIDELFVLAAERSQGIGARLLTVAEDALAAGGCVRLQLQISEGNAPAQALYERRGYASLPARKVLEKSLVPGA
jgi:GNAT superfamily N-acetyltransferase